MLLRRRWTTLSWRDSAIACQHSCWRSCFSTSWLCCLQKFECFILGLEHRCPLTVKAKQAESTKLAAPRQCKKALALSELLLGNRGKYFSTGTCFCTTMTSLSSCTGSKFHNQHAPNSAQAPTFLTFLFGWECLGPRGMAWLSWQLSPCADRWLGQLMSQRQQQMIVATWYADKCRRSSSQHDGKPPTGAAKKHFGKILSSSYKMSQHDFKKRDTSTPPETLASTSCLLLASARFIIAIMLSRFSVAKESRCFGIMYTNVASSPVERMCYVDARYVPKGPATL